MFCNFYSLALVALLIGFTSASEDRTVEVQINPQCKACDEPDARGSYNNLVYVKATGLNDTVHMFYSNIQAFSIMFFKTAGNESSEPLINSANLLSRNASTMADSITFNEPLVESFGYTFPFVYELNDTTGAGDMTLIPANQTLTHLTSDFVWKKYQVTSNSSGMFEGSLYDNNENNNNNNHNTNIKNTSSTTGSFKFVLRYAGKNLRDTELPRMLLNPESISVDFVVDHVRAAAKDAKYALNVLFLSENTQVRQDSRRTLDDEYTPATFKLWHVEVDDQANKTQNYFQWRPLFYFYETKNVENSSITVQYPLAEVSKLRCDELGLGSVFFEDATSTPFSSMNISFGLSGDAKNGFFYPQHNYSMWTFSAGMGTAPVEKMSPVVSLVIAIGFGLPALVVLFGLVFMIGKKIRNRSRYSLFEQL